MGKSGLKAPFLKLSIYVPFVIVPSGKTCMVEKFLPSITNLALYSINYNASYLYSSFSRLKKTHYKALKAIFQIGNFYASSLDKKLGAFAAVQIT